MRYVAILLALFAFTCRGQGWVSNAYPAASNSALPSVVITQAIVAITGSTSVSNGSTGWQFITTNLNVGALAWFRPTNGVWDARARVDKVYVKTAAMVTNPPTCSDYLVITNTVTTTNIYESAACITNPGLVAALPWSNSSNTLNCQLVNVPQLLAISYTQLVNSNADGATSNHPSHFWFCTNSNLNIQGAWDWDDGQSTGEKCAVLNIAPPWQKFGFDIHDTVAKNLPNWKTWLLSNAAPWIIRQLADDGAENFTGWCTPLVTNLAWQAGTGATTSMVWNGSALVVVIHPALATGWYGTNYTKRIPPVWGDTFYLTLDGSNITDVAPYQFAQPLSIRTMLCLKLGLPMTLVPVVITNTGEFPGWRVGMLTVNTTNTSQVVTARVVNSDYFSYTPDMHGLARGHLVTNLWTLQNRWVTWDTNQPVAANESVVVTNPLPIAGNTYLNVGALYYTNGIPNAYNVVYASNSVFETMQITGFTNWVATNIVSGVTNIVAHTNTSSVAWSVIELDYASQITNITVAANSNLLLSLVLTNAAYSTNASAVFTNYNVAAGWIDSDYEYDPAKLCLNNLTITRTAVPQFWRTGSLTDTYLINRYGTSVVGSLFNTNLYGAWLPSSVDTDSLADAVSAIVFTPQSGVASVPFQYSVAYPTTTVAASPRFRKDVYSVLVTNLTFPDANLGIQFIYYTGNFEIGPCITPNYFTVTGCGDIYSVFANLYIPPTNCYATDQVWANSFDATYAYNSGGNVVINVGTTIQIWHGLTAPSDGVYCCDDGTTIQYYSISWALVTNDLHDTVAWAYSTDGTFPTLGDAIFGNTNHIALRANEQSIAGVFTDISKSYQSVRAVYVAGSESFSYTAGSAVSTNLPVPADTNGTALVTWTNGPAASFSCTNADWTTVFTPIYYQSVAYSFPTNGTLDVFYEQGSNFVGGVTNLYWPTAPLVWTPPPSIGITNAWDSAAGVSRYVLLAPSPQTGTTNTLTILQFLSNTFLLPLPSSADSTLRGWGLQNDAYILADYGETNGTPHRP